LNKVFQGFVTIVGAFGEVRVLLDAVTLRWQVFAHEGGCGAGEMKF
jgi:hypothetical protein